MPPAKITISGFPGSGTSTLAQNLSKMLGYEYLNAGKIFRNLAAEQGVSLADFSGRAESEEWIDLELDYRMLQRFDHPNNEVLEGRLAGWMASVAEIMSNTAVECLTIYLQAGPEARIRRLKRRDGGSAAEAKDAMVARERSERERYLRYYGIDMEDVSIYDLVIDSEENDAQRCFSLALAQLEES